MNSRMSYSELGKSLDLTPQAVHRRVQALMEAEIIAGAGHVPDVEGARTHVGGHPRQVQSDLSRSPKREIDGYSRAHTR
jgi:DNA-binding Lrp family transcriptional regulator